MVSDEQKQIVSDLATKNVESWRRDYPQWDDEMIRQRSTKTAVGSITAVCGDAWDQETLVEVYRQGVERALKQGGG